MLTLEKIIGSGCHADVWKAARNGREVAVKVLKETTKSYIENTSELVIPSLEECHMALSIVEHSNIIKSEGVFFCKLLYPNDHLEEDYFLVMEYFDGIALTKDIAKKMNREHSNMIISTAFNVAEQMYQKGYFFTDIKIENTLVSNSFEFKLIDIHLSQGLLDSKNPKTKSHFQLVENSNLCIMFNTMLRSLMPESEAIEHEINKVERSTPSSSQLVMLKRKWHTIYNNVGPYNT